MKNKRLHTTDNPNTTAERKLFDFVLIIICLAFGLRFVYGAPIVFGARAKLIQIDWRRKSFPVVIIGDTR